MPDTCRWCPTRRSCRWWCRQWSRRSGRRTRCHGRCHGLLNARGPSVPSLDFSLPGAGCGLGWTCSVPGSLTRGLGLIGAIQTPLTPPPPHPSVSQRLLSYIATGWTDDALPVIWRQPQCTLYCIVCTVQLPSSSSLL